MNLTFVPTPIGDLPRIDWHQLAARRSARPIDPALRGAFVDAASGPQPADRLFAPGAMCVTTGQQPGLFTGPLLVLYKALSAVALARRLERTLARPVVPVFWVAGDDHDLAESNHTHLLTPANEVERIALADRPPEAALTPLYRERLGDGITHALDAVTAGTTESEFRHEVLAWLGRHYRADADYAGAFAGAMADWLSPHGLAVFRPTHAAAKAAMRPWLIRTLAEAQAILPALVARADELRREGRPAPVGVDDQATPVMLEATLGRDRLVRHGDGFRTRRSGEEFTLPALRAIADTSPARLSPNVLLRPVVEAAILPTVAYVGGPGELAYFPQCAPLYSAHGVHPQVPVPRWSARVVEARVAKVLEKYDVAANDLTLAEGQLEQRLVRDEIPASAVAALEAIRRALDEEYTRLRDAAVTIDPTLRKPIESTQHAARSGVDAVEKRLVGHLKQRNDVLVNQLAKARVNLFPLGRPQERVLSPLPFLMRYGPSFLDAALGAATEWVDALEPGLASP